MRLHRRKIPKVWEPRPQTLEIVRLLLLLQTGFAILSLVEVAVLGLVTGTIPLLAPSLLLSAAIAIGLPLVMTRIGRGSPRARRLAVVGESVVLLTVVVDLALAALLIRATPTLMPVLTRLALPVAVIVLLRRDRGHVPTMMGASA